MYKHIAVCVDGSQNAMRATAQAVELAKVCEDVRVDLLSVIAIDVYADMVYDPVATHGDAQAELVLLHGRPAEEIINYVEESDVDLLVMGSRGLNAFQEFAIGSVSHKVLKHVKCPALVVK